MSSSSSSSPPSATAAGDDLPALLLDMDGVLAEVSKSYRAAIVATCHEYGATSVTADTVSEWKIRGGCNNDWVLSRDLILDALPEKQVTLEEVTETFEKFYQGTSTTPGLCQLESLIPSFRVLQDLFRRCRGRVAVVTGRPRHDCWKFLQQHGLDALGIARAVCMEDGPPKPDPFPVLEACRLLNVRPSPRVVMVGDTPDDIRAAVAAGCTGVGVATPDDAAEALEEGRAATDTKLCRAMKECGASVLMEPGFEKLQELIK